MCMHALGEAQDIQPFMDPLALWGLYFVLRKQHARERSLAAGNPDFICCPFYGSEVDGQGIFNAQ